LVPAAVNTAEAQPADRDSSMLVITGGMFIGSDFVLFDTESGSLDGDS